MRYFVSYNMSPLTTGHLYNGYKGAAAVLGIGTVGWILTDKIQIVKHTASFPSVDGMLRAFKLNKSLSESLMSVFARGTALDVCIHSCEDSETEYEAMQRPSSFVAHLALKVVNGVNTFVVIDPEDIDTGEAPFTVPGNPTFTKEEEVAPVKYEAFVDVETGWVPLEDYKGSFPVQIQPLGTAKDKYVKILTDLLCDNLEINSGRGDVTVLNVVKYLYEHDLLK